ncbi:MAG: ribbon-helix-helix protein, CopG family [Candidatus Aminicenantes bacterium]|nr:ribbon-helix-helix protein, CopG family [Candidatus Aminicenantes bacterium]
MKIAISIPDDVFKEVERMAREQKKSRSQIFVSAAREYIQRRETRRIIEKLDEVYAQPDAPDEIARRKAMSEYQRKRLKEKERP